MLQNNPFYWGTIYKLLVGFGALFSDIVIVRLDKNGNPKKTVKVPCEYGPKEKWLTRNLQNPMPGVDDPVEMILPRIAYEINGFTYDSSRKLTSTGQNVKALVSGTTVLKTQFNPVPYNLGVQLNIMTKTAEDGLMIVEQVLPFFTPAYTLTINDIPDLNLKKDVPVVLTGVQQQDTWEGQMDQRTIIWTLNFTMKAYLYPPVKLQKVILDADINLYDDTTSPKLVDSRDFHASIGLKASSAAVSSGGHLSFNVSVFDTPTTNYTISLNPNLGTAVSSGAVVTYTAPTVTTPTQVTLRVAAVDDPRQSASIPITVNP